MAQILSQHMSELQYHLVKFHLNITVFMTKPQWKTDPAKDTEPSPEQQATTSPYQCIANRPEFLLTNGTHVA